MDIAVKGIYPIADSGFDVFAKGGIARVSTKAVNVDNSGTHHKILPYLGVGAGYSLTKNVGFDVQVAGTPKSGAVPAMYATTAGVNYTF